MKPASCNECSCIVACLGILSLLFLADRNSQTNILMTIRLLVFSLFLFNFLSCDESLPSRIEPEKFLRATYDVSSGVVEIRDSQAVGLGGAFVISVRNINVEVLQDSEFARAEIEIWLRDIPAQKGIIISTKRELTNPSLIVGGLITLRPNVTATFLKQWEHKTLAGKRFWEFVRLTPKVTPTGEPYLESAPVNFAASGTVQLFKGKAFERLTQIEFSLVYRIF